MPDYTSEACAGVLPYKYNIYGKNLFIRGTDRFF